MAAVARSRQVAIETSCVTAELEADGDRLVQVLVNLIGNAIRYSPAGSSIMVRAEADKDWLTFSVEDQGPGIPFELQDSIFVPFEQLSVLSGSRGEAGLGLSICKAIVEAHGGTIGVLCQEGQGSKFYFSLPRRG